MSIGEQQYYADHGVIAFHAWGNGDFDCIATLASVHPEGSILFMNHTPHAMAHVAATLSEWIQQAVDEISVRGALLHPSDYLNCDRPGIYRPVLSALSGVDCELNRAT